MKKDKNDFNFCFLVQQLSDAAKGESFNKDNIISSLSEVEDLTGNGEAEDYRFLASLQMVKDKMTFCTICADILNKLTDGHPEDFNPLDSASHKILAEKRRLLSRLQDEIEELEDIERYKELKDLRGDKPFGGDHPTFDDREMEQEFKRLSEKYDPFFNEDEE